MSKVLPYSMQDVDYDNDKFRPRSYVQGISQAFATKDVKRSCVKCTTGRFLLLLMICGVIYLITNHKTPVHSRSTGFLDGVASGGQHTQTNPGGSRIGRLLRKPPRLPPRLPPQLPPDKLLNKSSVLDSKKSNSSRVWASRQEAVKKAFVHAWSGYKNYAMGYDELMPLSRRGIDGLGGLGATVVDSLDTAIIMGIDEIVSSAGTWIENNLSERINQKGQVNLFETTIRLVGGLLSAYHLQGGDNSTLADVGIPAMGIDEIVSSAGTWIENNLSERINQKGQVNLFETTIRLVGGLLSAYHLQGGDNSTLADVGIPAHVKGPKAEVYLETAKNLADRLLSAFTSSPTPIPFSDVILRDHSAHPAPDGLSSTAEVATLQLEFNYLSEISGDPKYGLAAMKVFEHLKELPKVQGLVPIYINPHSGEFSGENIRLGSRGDSYYEYLIKVWLHQGGTRNNHLKYLHDMYEEAMKGVRSLLLRKSIPKGLVFVGELPYGHGGGFSPKMDHLVCFLPGTLALGATKGITRRRALEEQLLTADDVANLQLAEDLAKTCFEMYTVTSTGLAPEIAHFHIEGASEEHFGGGNRSSEYVDDIIIKPADRHNLLRPETVESLFVLYRITEDPKYREWGWRIFEAFERHTRVDSGGYSSLDDVTAVPPRRRDKMETFFLGETLKYLYLLFGDSGVLPLDRFVFNTEAHPLPVRRPPE